MQKILFRLVTLFLLFLFSLGFFVSIMKENTLTREVETTEMSEASLPVIAYLYGEEEMNFMYGYSKDTFSFGVREEIVPLEADGKPEFLLYHYGNEIQSVEYEMNNRIEKIVLETGEAKLEALDEENQKSKILLKLSYNFSPEVEYGLKFIIINKDGKKSYYYTTLKYLKNSKFSDNFKFVKKLEKAIFSKKDAGFVRQYLETSDVMDNMSFAHVNIHSSYDLVTWGELKPVKVTEPRISVLENNTNTASFLYKYVVSVGKENKNFYYVSEFYRVNSIDKSVFLLVYDRKMEEVFYPEKTSISKKQLKFGIGDKEVDYFATENKKFVAFVRERELWQYATEENKLSKVFSFRKEDFSSEREILDRHKVRLLRMEENGDVFFAVYGYMNRGVYEGRNGLVIYKYYEAEKRIEELVHLPADKLYKEFIHDVDRLSYLSGDGFFYFVMDGRFYSYSLAKKRLDVVAEKTENDTFLMLNGGREVAFQNLGKKQEIHIINLETRHRKLIKAEPDKQLFLFASSNDNMIYGIADKKDAKKNTDGSLIFPCEKLMITDSSGKVLKEYQKEKIYILDVTIDGSVINLKRLRKKEDEFTTIEDDQILNNFVETVKEVSIIDRRTEKYLTEYYLKLPKMAELKELPEAFYEVKNTVILSETTAKFPEDIPSANRYYAVVCGSIIHSSEKPYLMIRQADEGMGYVIDGNGMVVWERGKSRYSNKAEEIDIDYADEKDTEKEAAIRLFLTASGIYISDKELRTGKSIMEILSTQSEIKTLDLSGITLEEALYYVSEGNPVIAMAEDKLVLITAYQSKTVTLMNVKTGISETISKEEAEELFRKSGNRFISAVS